jgi:GntR family transcriptional regulator
MQRPTTFGQGADARLPKYLAIYRTLAAEIADGKYPPGSALPAQRELSQRFGVTLMTVRQAVRLLEEDGLLNSRQGAGTFVAQNRFSYELGPLRSLSEDFSSMGLRMHTTVIGLGLTIPPASVSARLGTGDAHVLALERLRILVSDDEADPDTPLMIQTSYLRGEHAPKISIAALRERSLYQVLFEDLGIRVGRAEETVQATLLGEREGELLGYPAGAPALLSRRLTLSEDGTPVVDDRAVLSQEVVLSADRVATGAAVRYQLGTAPVQPPVTSPKSASTAPDD